MGILFSVLSANKNNNIIGRTIIYLVSQDISMIKLANLFRFTRLQLISPC